MGWLDGIQLQILVGRIASARDTPGALKVVRIPNGKDFHVLFRTKA